MHTVLWKRLNQEGHDACRFVEIALGWSIQGTAVFDHAGQAASLAYRIVCDQQWESLQASVAGWIGRTEFRMEIERDNSSGWRIDGKINDALTGLKDIDLGFTPASNTNAIRRLNLSRGEEAETVAVWLDTDDWSVKPLRQTYRRSHGNSFEYTSPLHDYRATLLIDDFGAVIEYPALWAMLPQGI